MRISLVILLFLFCNTSYSQLVTEFDTLTYSSRMNSGIDSIDISSADSPSTFDGGIAITSPFSLSVTSLFNNFTSPNFLPKATWKKMEFSAMPHLGFSYSFGGQGSQFLKAKYNHAFSDSMLLQINYTRRSGIGSIRNAFYSLDDVTAQFQRLGNFYSMNLKGSFKGATINHPGGIVTDSLIEDFGLDFSPVYKQNANSRNRTGEVQLRNYFDFNKDSIRSLGLITSHKYEIQNRVYSELDTVFGIYNAVFIDSFSTRDQFNLASITNGGGIYFMNQQLYIDAIINHTYWDYQNLARHRDTSEISFSSFARINWKGFSMNNDLNFNILGRFNEFNDKLRLGYRKNKLETGLNFLYEQKAPSIFQRSYFSNNTSYNLSTVNLQQWMKVNANLAYQVSENISVKAFSEFANINRVYLFDGNQWEDSSFSGSFYSLGVNAGLKFGVFNLHPRFVYSTSNSNLLPKYQASSRVFLKGKIFKDKKLDAVLGVDVTYVSGFNTKRYIPSMDTYDWTVTPSSYTEQINMHAFLSLGISQFRFFFRYENIGYFWSDKTSEIVNSYPIAGSRLRIGLTWDFFN